MTDGKPAELGLAHLEVARAPTNDLDLFVFSDRVGGPCRFEPGPELFVRAGDDRDVGRVIRPLHLGARPLAASAFLDADERAIVQAIGGGEDFPRADEEAGFGDRLDALGPGLEVIILLAIDFDADE